MASISLVLMNISPSKRTSECSFSVYHAYSRKFHFADPIGVLLDALSFYMCYMVFVGRLLDADNQHTEIYGKGEYCILYRWNV